MAVQPPIQPVSATPVSVTTDSDSRAPASLDASGLHYPFPNPPLQGHTVTIHADIKWLRSPLPLSLDHINCYLLRDGDGWCVLDTGMNSEAARQQWLDVISNELDGAPLTRVIVTHHHPDHVGLAGWLCDRFSIPLWMSESEYFHIRTFNAPQRSKPYWEVTRYFQRAGMSPESQQSLFANEDFNHMVTEMPASYHRIADGDTVAIGAHKWHAITSRGHAPEHVSLYCAELNLYISGDQLLPRITSNVSVSPTAPESDPLGDWLNAHVSIAHRVPDNATVLPAHQLPFSGVHVRLKQVIDHHQERLDLLCELCEIPDTAQALTRKLFKRNLDIFQNFLAVGECLAHLHRLMAQNRVERRLQDGIYLFCRLA